MYVLNHETGITSNVTVQTAGQLKPTQEYSVLYERTWLPDSFVLSNIANTNAVLDLWITNPAMSLHTEDQSNTHVPIQGSFAIRDLSTGLDDSKESLGPLKEPRRAFAAVAQMAIDSVEQTPLQPNKILQHTPFSIVQKVYPIQVSPPYIGSKVTVTLNPRELGDLMSFMYLSCQLPPNLNYCPDVGRAILRKVEFYLNDQLLDWYDDDWSVIHDDLFMDASERLVLDQILNGPRLLIPLKLFFCRKGTYFPLCAVQNQRVYINLYFCDQTWITDYSSSIDILNPTLVFDQIFLSNEERLYYMNTPQTLIIPAIYRETPVQFTNGAVTINMTPNLNVNMISWFIRNQAYEKIPSEFMNRYQYGYVTKETVSYTNFINWRGQSQKYIQTLDSVDIFVNNYNIIKGMTGDLYFKYSQPNEHGLSIPDNDIFSYCFSKEPKDITKRGEFNFSTFSSKTTNITIKFLQSLIDELAQTYTLYLYYYGYVTLSIQNGFGTVQP